ncbi:hypothetical protein [Halorussus amylolyticus]|uniref:hypothetical protein n=1 Tax=Halorussus amylolyticus TaxID=1126242 RepID=UPI00104D8C4D|nr:hypothetical protein [Halorussus amylolyticus]
MTDTPSNVVALADAVSELLYGIAGWLLVGLGVLGVVAAVGGAIQRPSLAPVVVFVVSMLSVSLGVFVNPRFRRRLNRRHAVGRFGRVRSVDARVLRSAEGRSEQCVGCDSQLREGLIRRYREEFALAGVPVYTLSEGFNYYCPACATTDSEARSHPDSHSRSPESTGECADPESATKP